MGATQDQLFGSVAHIDVLAGTTSIYIVIFSVIVFEAIIHYLELVTVDSPFAKLIQGIQKELMIAGGIAFLLKCVINTVNFDEKWIHALEFADILVPVTAFYFCCIGCIAIYTLYYEESIIAKSFGIDTWDLLQNYYNQEGIISQMLSSWDNVTKMEYHVSRALFHEEFKIFDDKFPFEQYMLRVFQKYLINIINIEPSNWMALIVISSINWVRLTLGVVWEDCYNDESCANLRDIRGFIFAGCLILFSVIIVARVSRYYQLKYLQMLDARVTLSTFLEKKANASEHHAILRRVCSQINIKARPIQTLTAQFLERASLKKQRSMSILIGSHTKKNILQLLGAIMWRNTSIELTPKMCQLYLFNRPSIYFRAIEYLIMIIAFYWSMWTCHFVYASEQDIPQIKWLKGVAIIPGIASIIVYAYIIRASAFLMAVTYEDEEVSGEVRMEQREVEERIVYIRNTILQQLIVRDSFKGSTTEYMESMSLVELQLTVSDLFDSLKSNHSTHLSREEFRHFFCSIGIAFSHSKWRHVLNEIDKNRDGSISTDEVIEFLFGNHEGYVLYSRKKRAEKRKSIMVARQKQVDMSERSLRSIRNKLVLPFVRRTSNLIGAVGTVVPFDEPLPNDQETKPDFNV